MACCLLVVDHVGALVTLKMRVSLAAAGLERIKLSSGGKTPLSWLRTSPAWP